MKQLFYFIAVFLLYVNCAMAQGFTDTWTQKQLMEPQVLADRMVQNKMGKTLVLNIGPDVVIKGSYNIGPGSDTRNLEKMRIYLQNVPKDREVVLYCGCCPFAKCPNIRPAFKALTEMGYKNARLLNIPHNIKIDWIDKKYPVNE